MEPLTYLGCEVSNVTWTPLYMLNNDTGCDWNLAVIQTLWTAFRLFDEATDGPALALPADCPASASPCP